MKKIFVEMLITLLDNDEEISKMNKFLDFTSDEYDMVESSQKGTKSIKKSTDELRGMENLKITQEIEDDDGNDIN